MEEFTDNKIATRGELIGLIKSQKFKCALSGVSMSPSNAELDHIVPVSDGGGHNIANLQVVHKAINRMKGTMSNDQFIEWCERVARASKGTSGK